MYLVIENEGEIPIPSLTILGASDKSDGDFIGKFGTGIKYAMAAALRNEIGVTVAVGNKLVKFGTAPVTLGRSTVMRVTTKVGWAGRWQSRDWTADMGKHDWLDKVSQGITVEYMIVREFVSNAMDEGNGFSIYESEKIGTAKGKTRVFIESTPEVRDIMDNLGLYFKQYDRESRKPIFEGRWGSICDSQSRGRIYAKGIFVRIPPKPTIYDYDFADLEITESRTVDPYVLQRHIGYLWAELPSDQLAKTFAKLGDKSTAWFESEISSWHFGSLNSDTVVEAIRTLRGDDAVIIHKNASASDIGVPVLPLPDGLYISLSDKVACYGPRIKKVPCLACGGSGLVEVEE